MNSIEKSPKRINALPSHSAPADGRLSDSMLAAYHDAGVLILRDFVPTEECQVLRSRALELVDEFNPDEVHSIFSTTKQTQLDDTYFIESGDKIRFFLEEDAFDESGHLRQSKEDSLNKMGHKMNLKQRNYRAGKNELTTEVLDPEPWPEHLKLPAEASAGTLVIFDGRAPHMSGPNPSGRSRHAYTLHVIDQVCHWPAENWLQRSPDLPLRGFA